MRASGSREPPVRKSRRRSNNASRLKRPGAGQGALVDSLGQVLVGAWPGRHSHVTLQDGEFEAAIFDEEAIVHGAGVSAVLPPDELPMDREARLKDILSGRDEAARIAGSQIRASAGSPYAIEVLVNGSGRAASMVDGLPFVKLAKDDIYTVRLVNDSDRDAAVKLTIDGVSCFAFSQIRHETGPKQGQPKYSV